MPCFDGHGSDIVAEARDPYASRGGFGRGLVARSPSRVATERRLETRGETMPRDAVIARSDVGVVGADHPLEGDPARQTLGRVYAAAYLSLPEERRSPVSIRAQIAPGRMI